MTTDAVIPGRSLREELSISMITVYITTFDSFALSVVKKYHYLLNISSDIGITDESIVRIEQKKIIDQIFEDFYAKEDADFINLVDEKLSGSSKYYNGKLDVTKYLSNLPTATINGNDYLEEDLVEEVIRILGFDRLPMTYPLTATTGKLSEEKLVDIVRENFDLRPAAIIKNFDLRNLPAKNGGKFYQKLAAYGHLGRTDLNIPWEQLDKVETLKKALTATACC